MHQRPFFPRVIYSYFAFVLICNQTYIINTKYITLCILTRCVVAYADVFAAPNLVLLASNESADARQTPTPIAFNNCNNLSTSTQLLCTNQQSSACVDHQQVTVNASSSSNDLYQQSFDSLNISPNQSLADGEPIVLRCSDNDPIVMMMDDHESERVVPIQDLIGTFEKQTQPIIGCKLRPELMPIVIRDNQSSQSSATISTNISSVNLMERREMMSKVNSSSNVSCEIRSAFATVPEAVVAVSKGKRNCNPFILLIPLGHHMHAQQHFHLHI